MPRVEFRGVCKTYPGGAHAVQDLDLAIEHGEFLCILGPSGCGKSSTLRMLAGLEAVTAGDLLLDGERINDLPPQARDMAMVFENYALYPHLKAFDNIAMPLVARGVPRAEIQDRVRTVAETLQITEHLHKRPRQLSGGQRQRVAVGRAIVRSPRMFLMDEPLGHLEAYLRVELRAEVRRLHERLGTTTVYITHDQEEAAAVADRIAVMHDGRLQQVGSLLDLLDWPTNRFVAEFIGDLPINILPAMLQSEGDVPMVRLDRDVVVPVLGERAAELPSQKPTSTTVHFGIRPEDVHVTSDGAQEALAGRLVLLEPQGDTTVVIAETAPGLVRAVVPSEHLPEAGQTVGLTFAVERMHLFAEDGRNLLCRSMVPAA
jgi:multiple sugar transport system ATP-binding protein